MLMLCGCTTTGRAQSPNNMPFTVEAAGMTRSYFLHVPEKLPAGKAAPLVIVFHGSGDTGLGIESMTKFSELADREGFIAAYPNAVAHNWNDGRESTRILSQFNNVDDVAFVDAMITGIAKAHTLDTGRIFATGFSNGGIFAQYLGAQLSMRLAAIAPVSGGIAEPFAPKFKPASPVSVFIIHGTKDPMVPHPGGDVDYGGYGRIIPTDETMRLWTTFCGCAKTPTTGELPDTDPDDKCRVKWSRWSKGQKETEVLLYAVEGGGHTWPGGPQFMPVSIIGHVCRDFDATEAIWDFFKKHPKPY